jgi:hypothetical protein
MKQENWDRRRVARWSLGLLVVLSLLGIIAGAITVSVNNAALWAGPGGVWSGPVTEAMPETASRVTLGTWWLVGGSVVGVALLFFGAFWRSPIGRPDAPPPVNAGRGEPES